MKDYKCKVCGFYVSSNNSYVASHVQRVHKINLIEYFLQYENEFKNESPNFKLEKCGFCDKNAIPLLNVDYNNKTFYLHYNNGYFCQTLECKNNISLEILKIPYIPKKFEHIGANVLYISKLHKKDIKQVIFDKSKGLREHKFNCNITCYIEKYGEKEGKKRYKQRCKKISKGNTLQWYIDKFGEEEGNNKYDIFRKRKNKSLGSSISKSSLKIKTILENNNIRFNHEYKYNNEKNQNGSIDYYLPDHKIIIEYYGDFWHTNPNVYKPEYYNKIIKKFAWEIWEKDKKRIKYIIEHEFKNNITVLIIWESTKFTDEYLINLLEEIKEKNIIIEI